MYKNRNSNSFKKKSSKCEIHLYVNYPGDSFLNANSIISYIFSKSKYFLIHNIQKEYDDFEALSILLIGLFIQVYMITP